MGVLEAYASRKDEILENRESIEDENASESLAGSKNDESMVSTSQTSSPMHHAKSNKLRLPVDSPGTDVETSKKKEKKERSGSNSGGSNLSHRLSAIGDFLGGKRKSSVESKVKFKETPAFLFVGRRFKKHHKRMYSSTFTTNGRILKLNDEGDLIWFRCTSVHGLPSDAINDAKIDGSVKFEEILRISQGFKTPVFAKTGVKGKELFCFSIITKLRTLDLEAETTELCYQWVQALNDVKKNGIVLPASDDEDDGTPSTPKKNLQSRFEVAQQLREEEKQKAINKHSAERDKLRRIRTHSAARASQVPSLKNHH